MLSSLLGQWPAEAQAAGKLVRLQIRQRMAIVWSRSGIPAEPGQVYSRPVAMVVDPEVGAVVDVEADAVGVGVVRWSVWGSEQRVVC